MRAQVLWNQFPVIGAGGGAAGISEEILVFIQLKACFPLKKPNTPKPTKSPPRAIFLKVFNLSFLTVGF